MIEKIDHIGIAVESIDKSLPLYTEALGLKPGEIHVIEGGKLRIVMIPVGESKIELLESRDPQDTISKFIRDQGEGIHHLALEVRNIEAELSILGRDKAKHVELIDEIPRPGVEGGKIAFFQPRGSRIQLELVEPRDTQ